MGSFGISEGNITEEKKEKHPQNIGLTVTPSREVAQKLTSATSKQGLNREARAALLRVRNGPECPEGNLRDLTRDSNPDCGIALPHKALTEDTTRPAHRTKK